VKGVAIWAGPGEWRLSGMESLRYLPTTIKAFGLGRAPLALKVLTTVEQAHPAALHWYLETLGTDPEHQGKGVGSALLQPGLDRCDDEGLPAYLESSKESNLAFYARHGFEVTREINLPNGPTLWAMWRAAR
jgi:ribosomal protein S18 acetylase RimI-like enzyme